MAILGFLFATSISQTSLAQTDPRYCGNYYCAGTCAPLLEGYLASISGPNQICGQPGCAVGLVQQWVYTPENGGSNTTLSYYAVLQFGFYPLASCYEVSDNTMPAGEGKGRGGGCQVPAHSSIVIDTGALIEDMPLVGIPFKLVYASDRFGVDKDYSPVPLGLGGWAPSVMHHHNRETEITSFGYGDFRKFRADNIGNILHLPNEEGTEVYFFDMDGNHLHTKDALTGAIKYSFQYQNSRLVSVSDGYNNTTTFEPVSGGVRITSPYGQISNIAFDNNGYLASLTNPSNEVYNVTSDSSGFLQTFQKPMGQKSVVTYSGNRVVKDVGQGGDFVSLLLTRAGSVQTVTVSTAMDRKTVYNTKVSPVGVGTTRDVVESFGEVVNYDILDMFQRQGSSSIGSQTKNNYLGDPRFGYASPYVESSEFKVAGTNINVRSSTTKSVVGRNPDDILAMTSLNSTTQIQNDPSRLARTDYTAANRKLLFTSPSNRTIAQTLNEKGNVVSIQYGNLSPLNAGYDSRGRLSQISHGPRALLLSYDSRGNISAKRDSLNHITRFEYDASNRLTKQIMPNGDSILTSYDQNGNITSITPPGRNPHFFTYNLMELTSGYLPPALQTALSTTTTYEYNLDQQLTRINRPDGKNVDYIYESTSPRLTQIQTPNGNYELEYVANSKIVKSIKSPDQVLIEYENLGGSITKTKTSGPIFSSISYSYDSEGRSSGAALADASGLKSSLPIVYDSDSLIIKVGDESILRNANGAVSATSLGVVSQSNAFDSLGNLLSQTFKEGNTQLYSASYSRDGMGRISRTREFNKIFTESTDFTYDLVGRLTMAKGTLGTRTYKYDANGNRIEMKGAGKTFLASYDSQDRLISYGTSKFIYDVNGDLSEKQELASISTCFLCQFFNFSPKVLKKTTYNYDVFGNLKTVVMPTGKRIDYLVDGQNRRVGKKINGVLSQGFIYQSQYQIAAELDKNGRIVKQFIYGEKPNIPDYMIFEGKKYRIISDQVGTPKIVVDSASGRVREWISLNEFGVPDFFEATSILPFGYAGGLYDRDTGLVRFGARDYDPEIGRWLTKDPIGFDGGDTNLYGYVLQDPVNLLDPRGTNPAVIGGAIVGGIVGGIGGFYNADPGCTASGIILSTLSGAAGGAVGGAVAGLTGGAVSTVAGGIGAVGFDLGAAILGQAGYSCPPKPPLKPPTSECDSSGKK